MKKIDAQAFNMLITTLAVIAVYAVMMILGLPCPIKFMSGISCAGCGMTRAFISVLKGDFAAAIYYHPLVFFVPIAFALLLVAHFMGKKKLYNATLITGSAIMIAVWLVRLAHPECDVVTVDFDSGLIGWIRTILS